MNTITQSAESITSIIVREFIEAGGEISRLETVAGDRPDETIHVFSCEDRDGTFTSDNAGVTWLDADFDRVLEAINSADFSGIPDGHAIAKI